MTKTTGAAQVVHVYSHNNLNQLTGFTKTGAEAVSYTYDTNGNRQTRTQGAQTDTYTWDVENRLVQIAHAATAKTYRYGYDHRTRRVIRQEGAETALVQHAGGTSFAEWTLPTGAVLPATYGSSGSLGTATLSKVFIRGSDMGGGVGGLLYSEKVSSSTKPTVTISGNATTWPQTTISNLALAPSLNHYNGRGDVVAKTDASGSVTWTGSYEAFGTRTRETGTNDDRQRANTKDEDPTGLLNEGFRYRDLETGTWLSRDPAGFVDGPNLYAYVRANPWSRFDPLGLFEVWSPLGTQPVHETITARAYANANGVANQRSMSPQQRSNLSSMVSGVKHPDLGKVTDTTNAAMAAGYLKDGKSGAAIAFALDRAKQLFDLHYGDRQSEHSMSSDNTTKAQQWIARYKDELNTKFDSALQAQREGKSDVAHEIMGEISHTIQDSYSRSHMGRDPDTGKITNINNYGCQDGAKHKVADHVDGAQFIDKFGRGNVDDYDQIKGHPGVSDATDATTNVISAFQNGDKDAFNQQLDKTYDLAPGATAGGSGGYGKDEDKPESSGSDDDNEQD